MDLRKKFLSSRLEALQKGTHTDCTFLVGSVEGEKQEVHAVKAMMMMSSDFMRGMFEFESPMGGPTVQPFKMDLMEPPIFKLIVEFIHLTELITPVSCEDAVNLVIAADQLLVDSLRQYCKLIIKEKVTEENVWTVLDKLLSFNLTDVAEACNSILSTRTLECIESESFLSASSESIIALLKLDKLALKSEHQLLQFCWNWAENQPNKREAMRSLVPHLRLLTLAPSAAAQIPPFLEDSERAAILQYAITQDVTQLELPSTLCLLTAPRMFPFNEVAVNLIPDGMLTKGFNDMESEFIRYSSNSYAIANSVTLSVKRDFYLTGLSGLSLTKAKLGIEFNSASGVYEKIKDNEIAHICSISLKGMGHDENWELANIPYDSCWSVRLKKPLLLKKNVGEYSITVYFTPRISHGTCYYLRNVREDSVNEVIDNNLNSKIFNSVKTMWVTDYHSRNTFGPNGPIFLKSFSYVIDPDLNI